MHAEENDLFCEAQLMEVFYLVAEEKHRSAKREGDCNFREFTYFIIFITKRENPSPLYRSAQSKRYGTSEYSSSRQK
jgi:hypothetical protein